MTRYILIDNASGYIWGDSIDAQHAAKLTAESGPLDVARAVDEDMQEFGRTYEETYSRGLASNETGYHVYSAPVDFPRDYNGQDQAMIEAVERLPYVTTIRTNEREGPADSMMDD